LPGAPFRIQPERLRHKAKKTRPALPGSAPVCDVVAARARRIERFLTQPFFATEQFTGLPGKLVSLADALNGSERILHDEFKDYPESALHMIGAFSEVKAKKNGC
jgi:F-type H+-transporting ATPase subunit beta